MINRSSHSQRGFTLVEVLITISILAIGLLGLAAMQVIGLRSNNSSTYRSQATLIASAEMVERMQANPIAAETGFYLNINSAAVNCAAPPVAYCAEEYNGGPINAQACTPDLMAAYDVYAASCGTLRNSLPAGATMTVTCAQVPCPPSAVRTVTISWQEAQKGGAPLVQTMSIPFTPPTAY